MANTLYVNKPGGVIVHYTDGQSHPLDYGDVVPVDKLADYVDPSAFADERPRTTPLEVQLEAEAHRRAALTENGQINSASSPVPGNYSELDEDGAAQLVANLARFPNAQQEVVIHEILFGGSRQKVLDSATDAALIGAQTQLSAKVPDISPHGLAVQQDHTESLKDTDSVTGAGDPAARPGDSLHTAAIVRRHAQAAAETGSPDLHVPPPTSGERAVRTDTSTVLESPNAGTSLVGGPVQDVDPANAPDNPVSREGDTVGGDPADPSTTPLAQATGDQPFTGQEAHAAGQLTEDEQQALDARHGNRDKDGGDQGTSWDDKSWTNEKLDGYIDQHDLDVAKSKPKGEKIDAIKQHEGHEQPQTPPQ
jgi:hypothetical protein